MAKKRLKKRGPKPDRLKITGDPGAALDKLLRPVKPPTRKPA
jgi:hypothetical protein